jgi:hypothetical protein
MLLTVILNTTNNVLYTFIAIQNDQQNIDEHIDEVNEMLVDVVLDIKASSVK